VKVSELLAYARDELFKGWTHGELVDAQTGNVCAVGALRRATMSNVQNGSAKVFNEARRVLNVKAREMAADVGVRGPSGFGISRVEEFNDFCLTTQQDVLNLMDKAIIGLEEQGR
jgi:hypothetical protein